MGFLIEGFGCDYLFIVREDRLDIGWFEGHFGLGADDFAMTDAPGVVAASTFAGGRRDVWGGDCEPPGLSDVLGFCEDGSFIEFLDLENGMWRCCGKDGGVVYEDVRPARPITARPRAAASFADGDERALTPAFRDISDSELLSEARRRMVVPIAYSREDVADVLLPGLCLDASEEEGLDAVVDEVFAEIEEKAVYGSPEIEDFDEAWFSFLRGAAEAVARRRAAKGGE